MTREFLQWLAGAVVLLGLAALAVLHPLDLEGYETLPWIDLIARVLNLLLLAALLCLIRVLLGPTAADRIIAIDILGILVVGLCALLSLATGRSWYLDIGIVWALQSFIGSLALARRLEGRSFDD